MLQNGFFAVLTKALRASVQFSEYLYPSPNLYTLQSWKLPLHKKVKQEILSYVPRFRNQRADSILKTRAGDIERHGSPKYSTTAQNIHNMDSIYQKEWSSISGKGRLFYP